MSVEVRSKSFVVHTVTDHPEFDLIDLDDAILALCEARQYLRRRDRGFDAATDMAKERLLAAEEAAVATDEQLEALIVQAARDVADERCPPPRRGGLTAPWERFRILLTALLSRGEET